MLHVIGDGKLFAMMDFDLPLPKDKYVHQRNWSCINTGDTFLVAFYDRESWNGAPDRRILSTDAMLHAGAVPFQQRKTKYTGTITDGYGIAMHGSWIGSSTKFGKFCIACRMSVVQHHGAIGSHCYIGEGASIGQMSQIGDNVYVGKGSTVDDRIKICSGAYLMPGTILTHDIATPGIYGGTNGWLQKEIL